jgi:hypothetical protein
LSAVWLILHKKGAVAEVLHRLLLLLSFKILAQAYVPGLAETYRYGEGISKKCRLPVVCFDSMFIRLGRTFALQAYRKRFDSLLWHCGNTKISGLLLCHL